MSFKSWLNEWEGNTFNQEEDLVNGPEFPRSKYKGKGNPEENPNFISSKKIDKKFGFNKKDSSKLKTT